MKMQFLTRSLLVLAALVASQLHASAGAVDGNEFVDLLKLAKTKTTSGDWAGSAAAWQTVVDANPVNGEYWEMLAEANYRQGQFQGAIQAWKKVLELNGYCFPSDSAYNIARSFATSGDKGNAVLWLQKAFEMGLRDMDGVKRESAFKSILEDPRVVKLLAGEDVGAMTRTQGWEYDLSLLQREVERKAYPQYVKLTREQFRSEVESIRQRIPALSDTQAVLEVMKLMADLGVGHTEIVPRRAEFANTLPLKFFLFQEGLFVVAADPKYQDLLGAQVLSFGGTSVEKAVAAVAPYIYRDNPMWVKTFAPYALRYPVSMAALKIIPDPQHVQMEIRDTAGKTRRVVVEPDQNWPDIWNIYPYPSTWLGFPIVKNESLPLYRKNMQAYYWFEYIRESRTVYFQFNRVLDDPSEPFEQFVSRLASFVNDHDVERLVIDMRWNNGGNTYILPPLVHALISNPKVNREGALFVIVGRRTFSAAQNAASYIQRETHAIFVGEPTGGKPNSAGDEVYFSLPYSHLLASVADVYWEGSWPEDFRSWIGPQIFVEPTFAAYRSNRDEAMDTILSLIKPDFGISQHPGYGCRSTLE